MVSVYKRIMLLFLCTGIYISCFSQASENEGWLFISHKQKLTKKFDLLADVQVRSADDFAYITTLLLRSAFSYNFNEKHSIAAGYTYKGDWTRADTKYLYEPENRVFEQYLFSYKIKRSELTLRFRLEQRFIQNENVSRFSQRTRAFVSFQTPVAANANFTKGLYMKLQNEIFLNIQNKENVNNSLFDQNRAYFAFGERLSSKADLEIGYIYWRKKEQDSDFNSNVLQFMITTSL